MPELKKKKRKVDFSFLLMAADYASKKNDFLIKSVLIYLLKEQVIQPNGCHVKAKFLRQKCFKEIMKYT